MSIYNALNSAISSTLSGGTALTTALGGTAIYYEQAPDNTPLPYVIWSYPAGGDENMTSNRMKNMVAYVRGYASKADQAGTIDSYCDALLHGKALSVTGWSNNFWSAREEDIAYVENLPDKTQVYSAGGYYRFRLT